MSILYEFVDYVNIWNRSHKVFIHKWSLTLFDQLKLKSQNVHLYILQSMWLANDYTNNIKETFDQPVRFKMFFVHCFIKGNCNHKMFIWDMPEFVVHVISEFVSIRGRLDKSNRLSIKFCICGGAPQRLMVTSHLLNVLGWLSSSVCKLVRGVRSTKRRSRVTRRKNVWVCLKWVS